MTLLWLGLLVLALLGMFHVKRRHRVAAPTIDPWRRTLAIGALNTKPVTPRARWQMLSDIGATAVADQQQAIDEGMEELVPPGTPAESAVVILIHEGVKSSDYRFFESGCFTWRDLPLTVTKNHNDAEIVGKITSIGRVADDPTGTLTVETFETAISPTTGDWIVGLVEFDLSTDCGLECAKQVQGEFLRGVSLEFGGDENGDDEVEWICIDFDEYEGYCNEFEMRVIHAEIGQVTFTGYQAMTESVVIDTEPSMPEMAGQPMLIAADATLTTRPRATGFNPPVEPPRGFFEVPEFQPGQIIELPDGSKLAADEFLVPQTDDGHLAVPLQITDSGLVFGHAAYWGQCHIAYDEICVSPPTSLAAYAHFHVGAVKCAGGDQVATGVLTMGCDHAARSLKARAAQDHYAHNGLGWADTRAIDGVFGPWLSGAVRPDLTAVQLRALRASSLSGDWRKIGRSLEMIGVLSVNTPGFPIVREAITASGEMLRSPHTGVMFSGTERTALTASCVVRRAEPGDRSRATRALDRRLRNVEATLAALDLGERAADALRASLDG